MFHILLIAIASPRAGGHAVPRKGTRGASMQRNTNQPPIKGKLTCKKCGKTRDCTAEEQIKYAKSKWPTCCGETMLLSSINDTPADGTGKS